MCPLKYEPPSDAEPVLPLCEFYKQKLQHGNTTEASRDIRTLKPHVLVGVIRLAISETVFQCLWKKSSEYLPISPNVLIKAYFYSKGGVAINFRF